MTAIDATEIIFWASAGLFVYSYLGYPLILLIMAAFAQGCTDLRYLWTRCDRRVAEEQPLPKVALVLAAYNEEPVIAAKLKNSLELRYPAGAREILLGLDAPTDLTAQKVAPFASGVRVFHFPERRGKLAVLRDLLQATSAEILVLSDANTILEPDVLLKLARHFRDPRVGVVVGEVRVLTHEGGGQMESLYWKAETILKFLESRLNCVMGANGAIYAVRRELFQPTQAWILEDFVVPMEIRYAGNRVIYDSEALGWEEAAPSLEADLRRRLRLSAGGFQMLFGNLRFLNPFKGMPAFAYWSHKVLRWFGPLFMIATFVTSALLTGHGLYNALFALQCVFYLCALIGRIRQTAGGCSRLFSVPFYFVSMNWGVLRGMLMFLMGRHTTKWSMTPRRQIGTVAGSGK